MKRTISKSEFRDAFTDMNRKNNFSYEGLGALFDYFKECESSSGDETELDVIAICCDYSEDAFDYIKKNYSNLGIETLDDLREHTSVVWVDDETIDNPTVIYQVF